jgi:hypothetical protein
MEKQTKIARFEGGPLDGDTLEIEKSLSVYNTLNHVNPFALGDDAVQNPLEYQKITYRENPLGSGRFICEEQ